ncbi:MAG: hypothetical protein M3N16_00315 [Actinomycetota bacterium]|nr:hypothetical protein [Actinomycetota bacterium]
MFGLDDSIAGLGTGGSVVIVMAIAVLLGLRHATDPDHLTAVSSLLAAEDGPTTRRAAGLGLAWGVGTGPHSSSSGCHSSWSAQRSPTAFTRRRRS